MSEQEMRQLSIMAEDIYSIIQTVDDACKHRELFNLDAVLNIALKKQVELIERLSQLW